MDSADFLHIFSQVFFSEWTLFTFIEFSEAEVVVVGKTSLVVNGNYNYNFFFLIFFAFPFAPIAK